MELTLDEMRLMVQVLQQVSFPTADAKIVAGQLQQKIEQELMKVLPLGDVEVKD